MGALNLYPLNELELLRGVNEISKCWGGVNVGVLGSPEWDLSPDGLELLEVFPGPQWRNQWLIAAELQDDAPPGVNPVPLGRHRWTVRLGFCQTRIQRAPRGGFAIEWGSSVLKLAWDVDALIEFFEVMRGGPAQRVEAATFWLERALERRRQAAVQPAVWDLSRIVREDALAYAEATGQIT